MAEKFLTWQAYLPLVAFCGTCLFQVRTKTTEKFLTWPAHRGTVARMNDLCHLRRAGAVGRAKGQFFLRSGAVGQAKGQFSLCAGAVGPAKGPCSCRPLNVFRRNQRIVEGMFKNMVDVP